MLICGLQLGAVSNQDTKESAPMLSCLHLKSLYESKYSIEQSSQCQQSFHLFKLHLTNAYNICRLHVGLPELSCNENSNALSAAQRDAIQISAAVQWTPSNMKKYFLEFGNWVTESHLATCVRKENGALINKSSFIQHLESAAMELEPVHSVSSHAVEAKTNGQRQRKRAKDEPFQSLGKGTKQLISMVAGALLWRARGGAIETGNTHVGRLLFSTLGYGGLGWFNGGTDGLIAGGLSSVPLWLYGWSAWQDQGRGQSKASGKWNEGSSRLNDALMMSLRGLFQTSLSGGYLLARGYDGYALASGGAMGLCYAGSYELDAHTQMTQVRNSDGKLVGRNKWIDSPTALGELCSGAFMGAGLSTTLQNGRDEDY